MKRNSPHTNRKNKPSPTKQTPLCLIASRRRHAHARFRILNSAPSWTKCLKYRRGSSRRLLEGLAKSYFKKKRKKKYRGKMRACVCVFTLSFFSFASGTDFSLAFGLQLCPTNKNLVVCADTLCCISPFVLSCCRKLSATSQRFRFNIKHLRDAKSK